MEEETTIEPRVVPMTAALFAVATKKPSSCVQEQEAYFRDKLVLIRHGERLDHANKSWKGNMWLPLHDPPLSNAGREQCFETALRYLHLQRGKKLEDRLGGLFSLFLISPFHRCVETALILNLVAFKGELASFVNPQLADWQQSKVFRTAPVLGGRFTADEGAGAGRLSFWPQVDALRATLTPFLEARAARVAAGEYATIPVAESQQWIPRLERWVESQAALSVWTSASTTDELFAQIAAHHQATTTPLKKAGRKGGPDRKFDSIASYAHCGVPYPEGKADLQRRCQQMVSTHFRHSDGVVAMLPPAVWNAVDQERKLMLPKYFETHTEAAAQAPTSSQALLPPLHVFAITHADVVAVTVEMCCPKYLSTSGGVSVPYCSVTTLTRWNNYYRIPPHEARAVNCVGAGDSKHGGRQQRNKDLKVTISRHHQLSAAVPVGPRSLKAPPSVEWQLEELGSTALLDTRIVVQVCK